MSFQRKRLKIAVACIPCRRRKVKCDGERPACRSCENNNTSESCKYPNRTDNRGSLAKDYAQSSFCRPSSPNGNLVTSREHHPTSEIDGREDRFSDCPLSGTNSLLLGLDRTSAESPAADSMNGVTSSSAQTGQVFGSSSAGFFMRHLQASVSASLSVVCSPDRGGSGVIKPRPDDRCGLSESRHLGSSLLLLPPRGQADMLIQDYWNFSWSLLPVINRPRIEAVYKSLWEPGRSPEIDSPVIVGIMNICFALGCHYSEAIPVKERKTIGDEFFSRAERFYQWVGDHPSLESVQYLLLLGIYLQSTSKVFQCWMLVGQAIRMAQSLGVHLDGPSSGLSSASVFLRECRRRTWHACVWLDRVLSATFGRPAMIPKWLFNSAPAPLMIDDAFLETQTEGSAIRPDGRCCGMTFFLKAVELYQILDDILTSLYLSPPKSQKFETKLTQILELDEKLQVWTETLPPHLKMSRLAEIEDENENLFILKRQAIILRIRFLHVRTLLFRPAVAEYCTRIASSSSAQNQPNLHNSSLSNVMLLECTRMCFNFAHELTNIFNRHLDLESLTGPLPVWWYSVLYVYTGATIILIQRLVEKGISPERTKLDSNFHPQETWNQALRILESYSTVAEPARRCLVALKTFSRRLFPQPGGGGGSTYYWNNNDINRDFNNSNDNASNKADESNIYHPVLSAPVDSTDGDDWNSAFSAPNAFLGDRGMSDHDILSTFLDESLWLNYM